MRARFFGNRESGELDLGEKSGSIPECRRSSHIPLRRPSEIDSVAAPGNGPSQQPRSSPAPTHPTPHRIRMHAYVCNYFCACVDIHLSPAPCTYTPSRAAASVHALVCAALPIMERPLAASTVVMAWLCYIDLLWHGCATKRRHAHALPHAHSRAPQSPCLWPRPPGAGVPASPPRSPCYTPRGIQRGSPVFLQRVKQKQRKDVSLLCGCVPIQGGFRVP